MSIANDCLLSVIGLSRTDCDCFDKSAAAEVSLSELYLDELDPINSTIIQAREDCEKGRFEKIMETARANGINSFKSDLLGLMLKNYQLKRKPFSGVIGKRTFRQYITTTKPYWVFRWYCANIVSGTATVTEIGAIWNETAVHTIDIYNNLGELVDSVNVSSTAGLWESTACNIVLPLHSEYVNNLEYYFVFDGTLAVADNVIQCSDCMRIEGFNSQTNFNDGWRNYVAVCGTTSDDLDFTQIARQDWSFCQCTQMNGLTMKVDFKCDIGESICMDELDFKTNPIALNMAHAIRYKSVEYLIDGIISSPHISRLEIINHELMAEYRLEFQKKYNELMIYIVENIDIKNNDCFKCKDNYGFRKAGILS